MLKHIDIIKKSKLFEGIDRNELESMLKCLNAYSRSFKKGEYVYRVGDAISEVGLTLTGALLIAKEDFWGNRSIISKCKSGALFGETFACSPGTLSTINVIVENDAEVMFLDVKRIMTVCPSGCTFHSRLIRNLASVLAVKNVSLNAKIEHLSKRTTKDKLLSYLSQCSLNAGSSSFDIPFNRQQLADYLCVDRSALSNELSKLQKAGVLSFNREHFVLK